MKNLLLYTLLLISPLGKTQDWSAIPNGTADVKPDAVFSQVTSAPQYRNPALMGSDSAARFDLVYRDQWPKFPGTGYKTIFAGYQQYIGALNGYAGLSYVYDRAGDALSGQQLSFQYAQNIRIGKKMVIRPAIQAIYLQQKINLSEYNFNIIDPGFYRDRTSAFDLSAGMLLYWNKLYLGAAANHLTQPNVGFGPWPALTPIHYSVQAGYTFEGPLSPSIRFKASPYVFWDSQGLSNFLYGLNFRFGKHILAGGGYRHSYNALLINAGYQHKYFRIVYSYDDQFYEKELGGIHEISLSVFFWSMKANKRFREMVLPF